MALVSCSLERIDRAGSDKLRTDRWLDVSLDFVTGLRDAVLESLRQTRVWQVVEGMACAAA